MRLEYPLKKCKQPANVELLVCPVFQPISQKWKEELSQKTEQLTLFNDLKIEFNKKADKKNRNEKNHSGLDSESIIDD